MIGKDHYILNGAENSVYRYNGIFTRYLSYYPSVILRKEYGNKRQHSSNFQKYANL